MLPKVYLEKLFHPLVAVRKEEGGEEKRESSRVNRESKAERGVQKSHLDTYDDAKSWRHIREYYPREGLRIWEILVSPIKDYLSFGTLWSVARKIVKAKGGEKISGRRGGGERQNTSAAGFTEIKRERHLKPASPSPLFSIWPFKRVERLSLKSKIERKAFSKALRLMKERLQRFLRVAVILEQRL